MDPGVLPVWLVFVVVALALGGLWHLCWTVHDVIVAAWGWLRRDRMTTLLDEPGPTLQQALAHELPLLGLPPERSAGELGFTGEQPAVEAGAAEHFLRTPGYLIRATLTTNCAHPFGSVPDCPWCGLTEARERRAPWWEAEHRAAYQSLGLDYPSGMLAAIRDRP